MFFRISNRINAPGLLGAFLLSTLCLLSGGCEKKSAGTPDWTDAAPSSPSTTATTPPPRPKTEEHATNGPVRFVAYNVENWLDRNRYPGSKATTDGTKPEKAKQAVIAVLAATKPDILGVCEIGESSDLAELQTRLKAAGIDLPHVHHAGGADPIRHLALLSRFPITATVKPSKTSYLLNGRTYGMQRGILDATVRVNEKDYRFLGAHLKSKRDVQEGDQEQMRASEGHLLRDHIEGILAAAPSTRLIAYGDFNDTKASTVVKTLQGGANRQDSLTPLALADSHGETWTQHWDYEDIYSRFDWIMVSKTLKPEVDAKASRVVDEPACGEASDHRPVMMVLE
ncbi:endonuclease/exonuclease/phosphatase family protein [Luteolibacter ambystomatis]|uniref:Endonuclease/exonuclease/phosphatase family protein n=1 Tax=Luteolibacter ambystomatis TaxID=2824561 RepID=A0A975J0E3_9BACT|nr:endonuclease/exonuclease/phosphatase family protein [Luteolibacter ambystomatis]QUE51706.1 endonuclease/exonuclease/phosphatase family protein [Luteolibacter ambystomatis]